jgi:predicted anti-sigma-YlaC factor YlaD
MTCEDVRMAAMALADGEAAALSQEVVERHAASCDACRRAIAEMPAVGVCLDAVRVSVPTADLWPAIEARIGVRNERGALVLLAGVLALYKLAVFAPAQDFGMWVQAAPLIVAAGVFVFLKQNPFQINAALTRQGGEEA